MAATSPYTQNDYAAVSNFRPYELPINDIFKGLAAQNMFWDQGAQRVRSVYDNALNLKLSLEPNKEIRDNFMRDADKQLQKLSTMDLSDPAVQRQGFDVFKPLFQDEGIMYDDAMTRHYEKVRNDALTYRSKDNGKEYSDVNLAYAMDGYQDFINSKDRMAGKKFYANRKEYTPFYDPSNDINDAMKWCKASSVDAQSPYYGDDGKSQTGYMTYSSSNSLSSAKVKECFEAGLSDKAKRQMEINGYVAFKNHPDALANGYMSYNNTSIDGYNDLILKQSTDIATLQNKKNSGKITPEEQQQLNSLLEERNGYSDAVDKLKGINSKLAKGDFSPLNDNYEGIAGLIYRDARTSEYGKAFSYDEFTKKMIADPVQMLNIREQFDAAQQQDDHRFQAQMQQQKIDADYMLAQLKGEITLMGKYNMSTGIFGGLGDQIPLERQSNAPVQNGYSEFEKDVTNLNGSMVDNNKHLASILLEDQSYMKNNGDATLNFGNGDMSIKDYLTAVKNGKISSWYLLDRIPHLKDYVATNANSSNSYADVLFKDANFQIQKKGMDALVGLKEKEVNTRLGGDPQAVLYKEVSKYKPVMIEGRVITPTDIADILSGKEVKGVRVQGYSMGPAAGAGYGTIGGSGQEITVDGKPIYKLSGDREGLSRLVSDVTKSIGKVAGSVKAVRDEVYGDQSWKQEPFYQVYPNTKNQTLLGFEKSVQDKLFPTEKDKKNITIDALDYQGGVKIIIPGYTGKNEDEVKLATNAQKVAYNDKEGAFYLEGVPNLDYSSQLGITPNVKLVAQTLIRYSAALPKNTYGTIGDPISIPVKLGDQFRNYSVTFENSPSGIKYVLRDETGTPRISSTNAYDLSQKIQQLQ